MRTDTLHVVHPRAASMDVHNMQITVSIRICAPGCGEPQIETRTFEALPSGIDEMVAWMLERKVDAAVMEGTGIYWVAPFEALETAGPTSPDASIAVRVRSPEETGPQILTIGVVDHAVGATLPERHVEGVEHELRAQVVSHGPADHAAAEGIQHDGEVQEPRPGGDVGDVRNPEPIGCVGGEVALNQVWRRRARALRIVVRVPLRRLMPLKPARRINLAIRLQPTAWPRSTSPAWMRGAPQVPREGDGSRGYDRAAPRRSRRGPMAPDRATHSTRWWRPLAAGTSWRRDTWPGWLSRTRRPGRDRAGCLREPGRGSCQHLTLLAQLTVLTPEPPQLPALGTGQTVGGRDPRLHRTG